MKRDDVNCEAKKTLWGEKKHCEAKETLRGERNNANNRAWANPPIKINSTGVNKALLWRYNWT